MNVTFYLGKGTALIDHREVVITQLYNPWKGQSPAPAPTQIYNANQAGTAETLTVDCPDNAVLQVSLKDVCKGGGYTLGPDILQFSTLGAGQGITIRSHAGGPLRIICIEDTSSSSSLSSSSSSSSSPSSSSTSSLS